MGLALVVPRPVAVSIVVHITIALLVLRPICVGVMPSPAVITMAFVIISVAIANTDIPKIH